MLPVLRQVQCMRPVERRKFLKTCGSDFVHCICECVHNLLKGNVPLTPCQFKKLSRRKRVLRELANKKTSVAKRRKIIQKGGFAFLLPAIAAIVSSFLGS